MSIETPENSPQPFVRIVNPEVDEIPVELAFYDETMDGVAGVTMPDPPETD